MNEAIQRVWRDFLDKKFSNLEDWIEDFDLNVLVGMGEEYTLEESDIDELANSLDEIHSCLIENGLI